jgi:tRNA (guanine10-N2)-dimethyltransferase
MRRLMFLLSGEHPTLPAAEVMATLKAERRAFKILEQLDQILVVETKADPKVLASRLAMCHKICLHLCTSAASRKEILETIASTDIPDLLPHSKTFAVKIGRVKRSAPTIDTMKMARELAGLIAEEVDFQVDLERPEIELFCVLSGKKCIAGITEAEVDRSQFRARRPSKRPAFHPSTLSPSLARCLVNLARTPRGGTLLDPFCGVGGILMEAGLIGARPIGIDISHEMVEGTRKNLEFIGLRDFELMVGDARRLPVLEVDAIATDPPYGRQATTGGTELESLYREAFPSMARVLKHRGHLCLTSPAELELEDTASAVGLRLLELHEQRVHRSLSRKISVFKKE